MSIQTQLTNLTNSVAQALNNLDSRTGNITALSTSDKTSLVAAINEVKTSIDSFDPALIDDALDASTIKTYSIDKIKTLIANVQSSILGGAGEAYDTLQELATELQSNDGDITNILTAQANRVAVDASQSFTEAQKTQGRDNIGAANQADIGDITTDHAAALSSQLNF